MRVETLIEPAWTDADLPEIVRRSLPRLVGLIFGSVDCPADLVLPEVPNSHPARDTGTSATGR